MRTLIIIITAPIWICVALTIIACALLVGSQLQINDPRRIDAPSLPATSGVTPTPPSAEAMPSCVDLHSAFMHGKIGPMIFSKSMALVDADLATLRAENERRKRDWKTRTESNAALDKTTQDEIDLLRQRVAELEWIRIANGKQLDARDEMIAEKSTRITAIEGELTTSREFWETSLRSALRAKDQQITALQSTVAELEKDKKLVDRLEQQRRHYSRPPMRMVTGWQWVFTYEGDLHNPTLRDAALATQSEGKGEKI